MRRSLAKGQHHRRPLPVMNGTQQADSEGLIDRATPNGYEGRGVNLRPTDQAQSIFPWLDAPGLEVSDQARVVGG